MEFTFDTTYDDEVMAGVSEVINAAFYSKKMSYVRIFGWVAAMCAWVVAVPMRSKIIDLETIVIGAILVAILVVLLMEKRITAYQNRQKLLAGPKHIVTVFYEEGFTFVTDQGKVHFTYDKMGSVAETEHHFAFMLSDNHMRIHRKVDMTGGTLEEFQALIRRRVGTEVKKLGKK